MSWACCGPDYLADIVLVDGNPLKNSRAADRPGEGSAW
jgi:hypothetical protein